MTINHLVSRAAKRSSRGVLCFALVVLGVLMLSGCPCLFDCPPLPSIDSGSWTHDSHGEHSWCSKEEREPNDTVPKASTAPSGGCASQALQGIIAGDDVDVYRVKGSRCNGADPKIAIDVTGARACLFVQCAVGGTGLNGCKKGRPRHMPDGLLGCCTERPQFSEDDGGSSVDAGSDEPRDAIINLVCGNGLAEVDAYVVVDGASDACVPYTISYSL